MCRLGLRIAMPFAAGKALIGRFAGAAAALMSAVAVASPSPSPGRTAPMSAYLMDPTQEVALARSAAPASISAGATVLVLTRSGYQRAASGTNGFVCMVSRSFSGAPDWPERWNPRVRAAECLNPQAARSVAPIAKLRTAMTLAGRTDAQIVRRISTALRTGAIPKLEPGAMSYMMSPSSYLQDRGEHDMAHVMFFLPLKDGASLGANMSGSPLFGGNYWFVGGARASDAAGLPPVSVLLMPAATWSNGAPASMPRMQR